MSVRSNLARAGTDVSGRPRRVPGGRCPSRPRPGTDWRRRSSWRRGLDQVPTERILLGGQNGHTAEEYAAWSGDLTWGSTRVLDGPHAELLRRAAKRRADATQEILDSDYGAMARACVQGSGHYFGAVDDAGIVRVARDFLGRDDGGATPAGSRRRARRTLRCCSPRCGGRVASRSSTDTTAWRRAAWPATTWCPPGSAGPR